MKRSIILFCMVLFSVQTLFAQINKKDSEYTGFNQFNIGDPASKFDTTIKLADSPLVNGKRWYLYIYKIARPALYQFAGITFNMLMLGFDENKLLTSIQLDRIPFKIDPPYPASAVKRDIKKILAYTEEQAGIQPEKKVLSDSKYGKTYGYDWDSKQNRIRVMVSYSKKAGTSFSFTIATKDQLKDNPASTKK